MPAYYNEIDPYAAQWLRNLIAAGHIAPGDVDERSIVDVRADDLRGYEQAHFFAGIGGWSYALRLAGWPDDRPVWTGSCPCQPFSAAGQGKAADDERHLWPAWFPLLAECRPPRIFGEQVEAAIGWGWLDLVFADLEGQGYACGAAVLPACGIGAPHIRQRCWFVADAMQSASERRTRSIFGEETAPGGTGFVNGDRSYRPANGCEVGGVGKSASSGRPWGGTESTHSEPRQTSQSVLDDTPREQMGRTGQPWQDCVWIDCTDGKARPVEPGTFPLAHGIPGRVGRLRAYGNAIVPQVAAEFIAASAEAIELISH